MFADKAKWAARDSVVFQAETLDAKEIIEPMTQCSRPTSSLRSFIVAFLPKDYRIACHFGLPVLLVCSMVAHVSAQDAQSSAQDGGVVIKLKLKGSHPRAGEAPAPAAPHRDLSAQGAGSDRMTAKAEPPARIAKSQSEGAKSLEVEAAGDSWLPNQPAATIPNAYITTAKRDPTLRRLPRKPGIPELPLLAFSHYELRSDDRSDTSDGLAEILDAEPPAGLPAMENIALENNALEQPGERPATDPPSLAGESSAREPHTGISSDDASTLDRLASELADSPPGDSPTGECPTGECPGAPQEKQLAQQELPGDVPLEQNEHPYDAPAATQSISASPDQQVTRNSPADFTARQQAMQHDIDRVLKFYLTHSENISRRGPWALMHAALPFGVESEVIAGNRRVNTLGWMCYNGVCARQRLFQPTRTGFRTNVGPGVQGHEGQFLAILAQSKVRSDYSLRIGNRQYTIDDLVRYEMATCREGSELTFKLIGLSHYLDPDQRWRDNRGHTWSLEKMVAEELAQPVVGAACGGTHRLMGLSYALMRRQDAGLPIEGHWKRAEQFLNDFVNYTFTLQNPDGSFSTEWFSGRGNRSDVERKVQTTGHIAEWLIYTLSEEHLRSAEMQAAVEYLLSTVGANPERDWSIGPRGHALRALVLYKQRVFGGRAGRLREQVAGNGQAYQRR